MEKLIALRNFLLSIDGVEDNKLDTWAENFELKLKGKHKGNGLALLEMYYTAIADIEDWPHSKRPVEILFAQMVAWIAENDCDRDNLDNRHITVVPDIHDSGTADLEFSVSFIETIEVIEDPEGEIQAFGKRWSIQKVPIDTAESFSIKAEVK